MGFLFSDIGIAKIRKLVEPDQSIWGIWIKPVGMILQAGKDMLLADGKQKIR
jgi:hypothetical protein